MKLSYCLCFVRHAMLIQIYLKMFRLDLAQKQLKSMKVIDEDSPLTMLATAWVHMNTVSLCPSIYIRIRSLIIITLGRKIPRSSVYIRRVNR